MVVNRRKEDSGHRRFRGKFRPILADSDFVPGMTVAPYNVMHLVVKFDGHQRWPEPVVHETLAQPLWAARPTLFGTSF